MKLDMQFLDHHSKQFLDLQAELIKIEFFAASGRRIDKFQETPAAQKRLIVPRL
jgi:hypothetical protein